MNTWGWEPGVTAPPGPPAPEPPAPDRTRERIFVVLVVALLAIGSALAVWHAHHKQSHAARPEVAENQTAGVPPVTSPPGTVPETPTTLAAVVPPGAPPTFDPTIPSWDVAQDSTAAVTSAHGSKLPPSVGAWHFLQSASLLHDGKYAPMPRYASPFIASGLAAWTGTEANCFALPAIGVNSASSDRNACTADIPPHTMFVHPSTTHLPVIAWISPVSAQVDVIAGVLDLDASCGDGVGWSVEQGTRRLYSGAIPNGGQVIAPPISTTVRTGESLDLIVDGGRHGDIKCDTTAAEFNVINMDG